MPSGETVRDIEIIVGRLKGSPFSLSRASSRSVQSQFEQAQVLGAVLWRQLLRACASFTA